jgi:hypothetical protein
MLKTKVCNRKLCITVKGILTGFVGRSSSKAFLPCVRRFNDETDVVPRRKTGRARCGNFMFAAEFDVCFDLI